MNLESIKLFFMWITYIGMVLVALGTIVTGIYSHKIESREKEKTSKIERERDVAIEKSNRILVDMTTFFGEFDNKLKKCFLLIDFDKSYSAEQLNNFQCFLKLYSTDRLYKFTITNAVNPSTSKKYISLNLTSVYQSDWNSNPSKAFFSDFRAESPFMIFDLWFFLKDKPENLTVRNLNQTYFELAVDSLHTNMIKKIAINANDWTIFERNCAPNNWQIMDIQWLPKSETKFARYFEMYNNMPMYGHEINPSREGAFKYSVSITN
ncbi:MAG: hypothetical protein C0399_06755 [Syntrophus sp. (in: bacteria)]|nr:hypothetical protein [Syntrophus sp. (in: bacteria)]